MMRDVCLPVENYADDSNDGQDDHDDDDDNLERSQSRNWRQTISKQLEDILFYYSRE